MLYTIRTTIGRERIVLNFIDVRRQRHNIDIKAVVHPAEFKGYIFIEGELEEVQKAVQGIPHVRGLLTEPVDLKKIELFLKPRTIEITFNRGDIVEVIGAPFKGEKGKVIRTDKIKNEVTIELLETGVPIPVTVNSNFVRLIEKSEEKKVEESG